jgi:hypothetical protein
VSNEMHSALWLVLVVLFGGVEVVEQRGSVDIRGSPSFRTTRPDGHCVPRGYAWIRWTL